MRLVQTNSLKTGDIIARDIISHEECILLKTNTHFREAFREQLIERNIQHVYIKDEISEGIEPVPVINSEVRRKICRDINIEFEKLSNNLEMDVESIFSISEILMDELTNEKLIWELEDIKINDCYTYEHCVSVAILSGIVCRKLGLNREQSKQIIAGALIHDIGKMILPKETLNKPGALMKEEYELIKSHAEIGYRMIKGNVELSAISKLVVLCHHEREDGSGYPLGKGKDLHIGAKIVAACDLFHALMSDRCYRKALPLNEVVRIARKEPINKEICKILEKSLAFYPVGSLVLLSNEVVGIVEKNFVEDLKRPMISAIYNMKTKTREKYKLNLQNTEIKVVNQLVNLPWE